MTGRPIMMSMQLSMTFTCMRESVSFERVTSLKKVKLKTTLPYMGLDILVPVRETDTVIAEECLRLPFVR